MTESTRLASNAPRAYGAIFVLCVGTIVFWLFVRGDSSLSGSSVGAQAVDQARSCVFGVPLYRVTLLCADERGATVVRYPGVATLLSDVVGTAPPCPEVLVFLRTPEGRVVETSELRRLRTARRRDMDAEMAAQEERLRRRTR